MTDRMASGGTLMRTAIVPKPSSQYSQKNDTTAVVVGKRNNSKTGNDETLHPSTMHHQQQQQEGEEHLHQQQHQPTDLRRKNVVRNSIVAGSIAGMASTLVMYPMDLIRTTMQASSMATTTATATAAKAVGGPLQVLRQIVHVGGVRSLYTGIALPLGAQAAYKGTVFTIYNTMEHAVLDYKKSNNTQQQQQEFIGELTFTERMFCGYVAGAINGGIFVTPVEFVRNQLIAQQSKLSTHGTSWGVIRDSIRTGGILSLWRGFGITTVRDGVGVACFFSAFAMTQQFLMRSTTTTTTLLNATTERNRSQQQQQQHQTQLPPFWIRLVSGAAAGLAYWVSSLPLDTMKTWIQSSDSSAVRVSPWNEIRAIYADYGAIGVVSRLNRGWQVAYGRGAPAAAITIGVYSSVYDQLQQKDLNNNNNNNNEKAAIIEPF